MPDEPNPVGPLERLIVYVGGDITEYRQRMGDVVKIAHDTARQVQRVGQRVARAGQWMTGLTAAVAGFSLREAYNFEKAMAEVATITETASLSFEDQREQVIELARTYQFTFVDSARAFYEVLSSGTYRAADAMEVLATGARLAVATLSNQETAVDALTTVMNAYGLKAGDLGQISDDMFEAIRIGKFRMDDLNKAMGRTIPVAAQTGMTFEEMMAAMTTLSKAGMDANVAMTAVRTMLAQVMHQEQRATAAAEELGIEWSVEGLRSKGFAKWLGELSVLTGGSTENLSRLYDAVRSLPAALRLAGDGFAMFQDDLRLIQGSSGATQEALEKVMESPYWHMKQLSTELRNLRLQVGEALVPAFLELLKVVNPLIRGIADLATNHGDLFRAIANTSLKVGLLLLVGGKLTKWMAGSIVLAADLKKALVALGVAAEASARVMKTLTVVRGALATVGTGLLGWELGKWMAEQANKADAEMGKLELKRVTEQYNEKKKMADEFYAYIRKANTATTDADYEYNRKKAWELARELELRAGSTRSGRAAQEDVALWLKLDKEALAEELQEALVQARGAWTDFQEWLAGRKEKGFPTLVEDMATDWADSIRHGVKRAMSNPVDWGVDEWIEFAWEQEQKTALDEAAKAGERMGAVLQEQFAKGFLTPEQYQKDVLSLRKYVHDTYKTKLEFAGGVVEELIEKIEAARISGKDLKDIGDELVDLALGISKKPTTEAADKAATAAAKAAAKGRLAALKETVEQELATVKAANEAVSQTYMKRAENVQRLMQAELETLDKFTDAVADIDAKMHEERVSTERDLFDLQQRAIKGDRAEFRRWQNERQRAMALERAAAQAMQGGFDPEETLRMLQEARGLALGLAREVEGPTGAGLNLESTTRESARRLTAISAMIQQVYAGQRKAAQDGFQTAREKLAQLQEDLKTVYAEAEQRVLSVNVNTDKAKAALVEVLELLARLADKTVQVRVWGGEIREGGEGAVPRMQTGGWVRGPLGPDSVPTWLSAGEFVVNRRAAAAFSPVLEALNRMDANRAARVWPRAVTTSGAVQTPPGSRAYGGDIHIHVNQPVTREVVRNVIVPEIDRARRRGAV